MPLGFAAVIRPATRAIRSAVHLAVICLVALLFLLQPLPPVNRLWCPETVHVGRHLHYLLNFDSPVYLDIAEEPARLFLPGGEARSRQARPLYMLAARLLERPLRDVPGLRSMNMHPAYPAFAVVNLAILFASLTLFAAIVGDSWRAWAVGTVIGILLFANDVAKVFVWTPHQQLFNILQPLACVAVTGHVAARPHPSWTRVAAYAFALGVLLLAYGSFALLLPAFVIGLVIRWRYGDAPRRLVAAGVMASIAFAVPVLVWVGFAYHRTGGFYVGETNEYRDFVWIWFAWHHGGVGRVAEVSRDFARVFLGTFGVEFVIPLFALGAASVLAGTSATTARDVLGERSLALGACAAAFGLNVVFFGLMGNYAARLSFNVLPPILAAVAVVVAGVMERQPVRAWRGTLAAIALVVAVAFAYTVAKPGPWC